MKFDFSFTPWWWTFGVSLYLGSRCGVASVNVGPCTVSGEWERGS